MSQVQRTLTNAHMILLDAQEELDTQGQLTASMSEQLKAAFQAVSKIEEELK